MTILRYRVPFGLKFYLMFPTMLWITSVLIFPFGRDLVELGLGVAAICAILWFNNAGYRIAYDDARLYMRGFGFWNRRLRWPAFHGIAFDDIALISMETDSPGPQGTRYVPGEYLEVVSSRAGDEDIWIYPQASASRIWQSCSPSCTAAARICCRRRWPNACGMQPSSSDPLRASRRGLLQMPPGIHDLVQHAHDDDGFPFDAIEYPMLTHAKAAKIGSYAAFRAEFGIVQQTAKHRLHRIEIADCPRHAEPLDAVIANVV
jgi:hypothetical protein